MQWTPDIAKIIMRGQLRQSRDLDPRIRLTDIFEGKGDSEDLQERVTAFSTKMSTLHSDDWPEEAYEGSFHTKADSNDSDGKRYGFHMKVDTAGEATITIMRIERVSPAGAASIHPSEEFERYSSTLSLTFLVPDSNLYKMAS